MLKPTRGGNEINYAFLSIKSEERQAAATVFDLSTFVMKVFVYVSCYNCPGK